MVRRTLAGGVSLAVLALVILACMADKAVNAATEHRLTKKELKALLTTAKMAEDHEKIAAYYRAEAKRLRADAKEHKEWADIYAKAPAGSSMQQQGMSNGAPHCQKWADLENEEADEAEALAKSHGDMAKAAH